VCDEQEARSTEDHVVPPTDASMPHREVGLPVVHMLISR